MLKRFNDARYNDSIATAATNQVAELQSVVVLKDHMITTQKKINEDYRHQLANKDEIEVNYQKEIVIHKKSITRLKTQRFLLIAIATVISGIAISK